MDSEFLDKQFCGFLKRREEFCAKPPIRGSAAAELSDPSAQSVSAKEPSSTCQNAHWRAPPCSTLMQNIEQLNNPSLALHNSNDSAAGSSHPQQNSEHWVDGPQYPAGTHQTPESGASSASRAPLEKKRCTTVSSAERFVTSCCVLDSAHSLALISAQADGTGSVAHSAKADGHGCARDLSRGDSVGPTTHSAQHHRDDCARDAVRTDRVAWAGYLAQSDGDGAAMCRGKLPKLFKCHTCSMAFGRKHHLSRHIETVHCNVSWPCFKRLTKLSVFLTFATCWFPYL